VQRVWNTEAKLIPVTSGETGNVLKSRAIHLHDTPGTYYVKEMQRTGIQ